MSLQVIAGRILRLVELAKSLMNPHLCVQGNVQGALYGILCFTGGLGSPTFALVFDLFSSTSSSMPYFPGKSSHFFEMNTVSTFVQTKQRDLISRSVSVFTLYDDLSASVGVHLDWCLVCHI